jgi:glycosyltransferase involved in cell wall biosynthesis
MVHARNPFKRCNNFEKYADIQSECIFSSNVDYFPKVTIAIPTYKRANLLALAINSALSQVGYTEFNVLVLDNDPVRHCETEKLLLTYRDPRISYFKNEQNIGMTGNWNRLFELSQSEYLVMLHDDDLLLPDYLVKMMAVKGSYKNISLLKPAFSVIRGEGEMNQIALPPSSKGLIQIHWFSFYNGNILGAPVGVLFNRVSFLQFGGFDEAFYPSIDFHFFCKYARFANVWFYDEYLAIYRYSENESLNLKTLNGFIEIDNLLTREILKHFKVPEFIVRIFLNHKVLKTIRLYKNVVNDNFELDRTRLNWDLYEDSFFGPLFAAALKLFNYAIRLGVHMKFFGLKVKRYFNG